MGEQLPWPAVDKFADPGLQAELKPQVASGEVRFCLGYTEPDGGSDIAGAKTRAVRDGDEWVINGQKIFTSNAQNSQYVFLITRTNPTLPKHKGQTVTAQPGPPTARAGPLLVRRDGWVAWVGSQNLPDALTCWFGPRG